MGLFRMMRNLIRGHQPEPGEQPKMKGPSGPGALPTPMPSPPPALSALGDPPIAVRAPAAGQDIER